MTTHTVTRAVVGPWSLATSRRFWEGFTPSALIPQPDAALTTTFLNEADWTPTSTEVSQDGDTARITVAGEGDLEQATDQVARFLSLDVDASAWADVGARDPVIGEAQGALPGLRPCGFHSPYEAAAWAVLSQRITIRQAANLRQRITEQYGESGAFPTPAVLRRLDLGLMGRKDEYRHAVADAALDGVLDGAALRSVDADEAVRRVRTVKGLGPFASELVVIRGANAPDALPHHEQRLDDEVEFRYGPGTTLAQVSEAWRPLRTWAAVHLRTLREERTHEISGR